MKTQSTGQPGLVELSSDVCWTLISAHTVGRLAWHGSSGVTIIPVNYSIQEFHGRRRVLIRTAAYSVIARECDDLDVAFEVDQIEHRTRSGWSVLLRGRCERVDRLMEAAPTPDVWPAGIRRLTLAIEVASVTGRRVL